MNSGDDGLEWEVLGRLGEVVVVVRWPAEPMQQEVKGCSGQRSCGGRTKEDVRPTETKPKSFKFRLTYLTE